MKLKMHPGLWPLVPKSSAWARSLPEAAMLPSAWVPKVLAPLICTQKPTMDKGRSQARMSGHFPAQTQAVSETIKPYK